jgi:mannose-6-phosphate isomerase-like protein (cupin superfamily)
MAKSKQVRKAKKPPARRSAGKTSARRRVAVNKVRSKTKAGAKPRTKPRTKAGPRRQTFVANHIAPGGFDGGLRTYAKYRDLGIAAATNGLARAHVIKMVPPCDPAVVSKRHYHDVEFQMIYVLKGWMTTEFEGQGAVTMREGSCWLQPPKIEHTVLDYSDDCEVLEIIMPADFDTVEL